MLAVKTNKIIASNDLILRFVRFCGNSQLWMIAHELCPKKWLQAHHQSWSDDFLFINDCKLTYKLYIPLWTDKNAVATCSASKIYVDPETPEVAAMKARYTQI